MTQTMLPSAPKDVGIISDVFISALGSITGGELNRLKLPRVKSSAVFMIDGLGSGNLAQNLAYASNLRKVLGDGRIPSVRSGFPATTASSLTSFGTGMRSGAHGINGYQVISKSGESVNMLSGWSEDVQPEIWQPNCTVAQLALTHGVDVVFIGPSSYEGSGFTNTFMRGARYLAVDDSGSRVSEVMRLTSRSNTLVYAYFPELDQAAHRYGVNSDQWRNQLEALDKNLGPAIAANAGTIITADHGVIDVSGTGHIVLNELAGFDDAIHTTCGDPRVMQLFGDKVEASKVLTTLGERVYVTTWADLAANGWCNPWAGEAREPDLVVVARGNRAIYDRRYSPATSFKMIGQHGGLDDLEQQIPLLKLGGYN